MKIQAPVWRAGNRWLGQRLHRVCQILITDDGRGTQLRSGCAGWRTWLTTAPGRSGPRRTVVTRFRAAALVTTAFALLTVLRRQTKLTRFFRSRQPPLWHQRCCRNRLRTRTIRRRAAIGHQSSPQQKSPKRQQIRHSLKTHLTCAPADGNPVVRLRHGRRKTTPRYCMRM